jgi:hypothetical protein
LNVPEPNLVQTVTREDPRLPDLLWGIFVTGIKPDRRQVIRAGAWTVPAIAVATAAPAFAASTQANLSGSSATAPTRNQKVITGTLTIRNAGPDQTSALTVTVTIASGVDAGFAAHSLPGFTVTNVTTTTVTFSAVTQLDPGAPLGPLTYTVTRKDNGTASLTTINVLPGNGAQGGPFTYTI